MSFDSLIRRATSLARGLAFAFLLILLTGPLRDIAASALAGRGLARALSAPPSRPLGVTLAISAVTVTLAGLLVRLYSRSTPSADDPLPLLGLGRRWWSEWLRGLAVGAGLATLAVIPMIASGQTEILGLARGALEHPWAMPTVFAILVLEAAREELAFRGPAQRELTRAVSFPVAAIFLSGSFALIHAGNPSVSAAGLTSILVAGLALAGLARARGDLGMVCGVHTAWNVMLGMVWSLPVSGVRLNAKLLSTSSNRSLWTGGSFGAEASVPALLVLFAFALVTWSLSPPRTGRAPDEPTGT